MGFDCEKNPRRIQLFFEKNDGQMTPVRDVEIMDIACGANHTVREHLCIFIRYSLQNFCQK